MINQILNYTIERKIGEGGMGVVYLASNPALGQKVAIKMLHPRLAANPLLREKFRQEAMLLSGLTHPNIVKFINYVENDDGVFLIMEYVDGITLDEFIHKKNGLVVEQRAMPMLRALVDAFYHAHVQGIVHCDIKPSNILIDKDGNVKILDFGIAKIISDAQADDITKGSGSPMYMSPEQVLGKPLDARSDIYSLGVVFYEILTGRTPYDPALSPMEIKHHVVNDPLPRMKEAYPYISEEAQKFVDKATDKNPAQRFPDSGTMLRALASGKFGDPGKGFHASDTGYNGYNANYSTGNSDYRSTQIGNMNIFNDEESRNRATIGDSQSDPGITPTPGRSLWWLWIIIGCIAIGGAVAGLLWWHPWEKQSPRQAEEEQELLGDDDALLIDADDETDDDNILLGANPTISFPEKSTPADDSGKGKKADRPADRTSKKGDSKKDRGSDAARRLDDASKQPAPRPHDNGKKPDSEMRGMRPESSHDRGAAMNSEKSGGDHDIKPKPRRQD